MVLVYIRSEVRDLTTVSSILTKDSSKKYTGESDLVD